jgi:hypothetical protein
MEFDYYELMFIASCIADRKGENSHYYGIDKTYSRYDTEQKVRQLAKLIEDETFYVHMEKHIKPIHGKIVCQSMKEIEVEGKKYLVSKDATYSSEKIEIGDGGINQK